MFGVFFIETIENKIDCLTFDTFAPEVDRRGGKTLAGMTTGPAQFNQKSSL
jgi:hypothetical protein